MPREAESRPRQEAANDQNTTSGKGSRSRRARGPVLDYRPRADTVALLDDVMGVLVEAGATGTLPLSVRAIYYRLLGGYVVGAPSVVEQGRYGWSWVQPGRFGEPLSWQAVTDVLVPKPEHPVFVPKRDQQRHLDGLVRTVAESVPGHRNESLHWAACRAVADGLDPFGLLPAALSVGLSEYESKRTIESAVRSAS